MLSRARALVPVTLPVTFCAVGAALAAAPVPPYFTDVTVQAGLAGIPAFRIAVADLDGDGFDDIVVHTKPDAGTGDVVDKQFVYLSVPGGVLGRSFTDHTAASNIRANRQGTAAGRHSDAAVFADVDNDGDLDIFTNVYVHRSWTLNKGTNDLLLNVGSAHFRLAPNSPFHIEPIYNTAAAWGWRADRKRRASSACARWPPLWLASPRARCWSGNWRVWRSAPSAWSAAPKGSVRKCLPTRKSAPSPWTRAPR